MIIEYGEWLPDLAALNNPGLIEAKNVLPFANGYREAKGLYGFAVGVNTTCVGAFTCKDSTGNVYNFAGDANFLYKLLGTTYTDISNGSYTLDSEYFWEFTKFGDAVIASSYSHYPQVYRMGTSSTFANLTTVLKAHHVEIVRSFVVFGNLYDTTDGVSPSKVRWSAINDETDYTESTATQSGSQILFGEGGKIQKIVGGEYGVIFQENAIWRMTYTGGEIIFQFDEIERGKGALAGNSVVKHGANIYYLGRDGFNVFNGVESVQIGKNKINDTFFADADPGYFHKMFGIVDHVNKLILWSYVSTSSADSKCDKIIVYDIARSRFTWLDVPTEILCYSYEAGYTLEDLDAFGNIDTLTIPLDSPYWQGGKTLSICAFDTTAHHISTFSASPPLTATIRTGEFQPNSGARSIVRSIAPLGDLGAGVNTFSVFYRYTQTATATEDTAVTAAPSLATTNKYCARTNGRYLSIQQSISGGFTNAFGLEVEIVKGGKR